MIKKIMFVVICFFIFSIYSYGKVNSKDNNRINLLVISNNPETQNITYYDAMGSYFHVLDYFFSPAKFFSGTNIKVTKTGWGNLKGVFDNLKKYNVIMLWEAPRKIIDKRNDGFWYSNVGVITNKRAEKIIEFVKNGGGLIIAGGLTNYGNGITSGAKTPGQIGLGSMDYRAGNKRFYIGYHNSVLENILPVEIPQGVTLTKLNGPVIQEGKSSLLKGLSFKNFPYKAYHKVSAKKEADVLLKTEKGNPLIAITRVGKGRVACITFCPKGNYFWGNGVKPLWTGFPVLLYRLVNWAEHTHGKNIEIVKKNYKSLISFNKKVPFWYLKEEYPYLTNVLISSIPWDIMGYYFKYLSSLNLTGFVIQPIPDDKKTAYRINEDLKKTNLYGINHGDYGASTSSKNPKEYAQICLPGGAFAGEYGAPDPNPRAPLTIETGIKSAQNDISVMKNLKRIIGDFYDDEWTWWMGYRNQYQGKPGIADYSEISNEYFKKMTEKNPPPPKWEPPGYVAPKNSLWMKWCNIVRKGAFIGYNKDVASTIRKQRPDMLLGNYPGAWDGELNIINQEVYLDCWRDDPIIALKRVEEIRNYRKWNKPIWTLIGIFMMPENKSIYPESERLQIELCLGSGVKGITLWNVENIWKPNFQHNGHVSLQTETKKMGKMLKEYGSLFLKLKSVNMPVWTLGDFGWVNDFDNYYLIPPPKGFNDTEWPWFANQVEAVSIPAIFRAQLPAEVVTEKQLLNKHLLFKEKAVVLCGLEYCTQQVVDNLEKYIKHGGRVYLDLSSKVKIKGAKILPVDLSKWHRAILEGKRPISEPTMKNWWKARDIAENYISQAIPVFKKYVTDSIKPQIECSPSYGIYTILKNGDSTYLFVYNDDIVKSHNIKVYFRTPVKNIYDIFHRKYYSDATNIQTDLQPGAWNVYLLSNQKLGNFTTENMLGRTLIIRINDNKGNIFDGAVPMKLSVNNNLVFYQSTSQGRLILHLKRYKKYKKIEIENLLTGQRKTIKI